MNVVTRNWNSRSLAASVAGLLLIAAAAATAWHWNQERLFRNAVATVRPWADIEGRMLRAPAVTVAELEGILNRRPDAATRVEEGERVLTYRWWSPLGSFRMYAVLAGDDAGDDRVLQLRIPSGVR
jgi:hypothetical protein